MTHQHHSIDYIEFSVLNLKEAKKFFSAAFGWSFNDYGPNYAGIKTGGEKEAGGLTQVESMTSGGPLVVLYSENLEASLEAVKSHGGQVVKDIFHFPGGRRFEFHDPSGNHLAVWST